MIKGKAVQTVDKTTKEITDEMTDEEKEKAFLYQVNLFKKIACNHKSFPYIIIL